MSQILRCETGSVSPKKFYDGHGTDTTHLSHRAGVKGIVCGLGGRYNTMTVERVDISNFLDMIKFYLLETAKICGRA